jgi:hypothetical protein
MAPDSTATAWSPIHIRRSEVIDMPALRRLASLDSRKLPEGTFIVADVAGEIIAAAPLESDEPALGDPFRRTEDVRRLLDVQARALRTVAIAA